MTCSENRWNHTLTLGSEEAHPPPTHTQHTGSKGLHSCSQSTKLGFQLPLRTKRGSCLFPRFLSLILPTPRHSEQDQVPVRSPTQERHTISASEALLTLPQLQGWARGYFLLSGQAAPKLDRWTQKNYGKITSILRLKFFKTIISEYMWVSVYYVFIWRSEVN